MKALTAIKKYMGTPGYNPDMSYVSPSVSEMKAFSDICTPAEKRQFGMDACAFMGVDFEE